MLRRLLWIDCTGGLVAGVAVLALAGTLARLEGLPPVVLGFTGAMNLVYSTGSFALARRPLRPPWALAALALANLAWAPVCLALLAAHADTATPLAALHLGGEALYVGVLGALEWRHRDRLRMAA